jgi:putative ubiquitin-RnfH superfamily antitoxin RatB of RatAB toxin-antitoxin module
MTISVEIVCAWPERAMLRKITVEEGDTVSDAIASSGAPDELPQPEQLSGRVGVFGKVVGLQHRLRDGDRIEIYRPLLADPKETRRRRAKKR